MGAKLLAAIEALRRKPWVVLALLAASLVGGLAQFTGATRALVELVRPARPTRRAGQARHPVHAGGAGQGGERRRRPCGRPAARRRHGGRCRQGQRADGAGRRGTGRLRRHGAPPARCRADPATVGEADTALEAAVKAHHPDVVELFLERRLPPAAIADAYVDAAVASDPAALALLAPHLAQPQATARDAIAATIERTPTRLLPMSEEVSRIAAAHPDEPYLQLLTGGSGDPRDLAAIRAVMSLKPPLDAVDANGQTLLHKAVESDASGIVVVLVAGGAKPDTLARCGDEDDNAKSPPLACAAQRGSLTGLASMRALLAGRAAVDARTSLGTTPLMLAADGGDDRAVAALLAAGADVTARDPQGRAAADHARAARFHDPAATLALIQAAARRRS